MKFAALALLLVAAFTTGPVDGSRVKVSPITRVVTLLQSLAGKIERELKSEEDLYDTFVCWGKSVISQKTASNEKGKSRVASLEQYIADLDAGKIELTDERVQLEKELKQLREDIEVADAQREKELKDYTAAKKDMTQALDALGEAIEVLEDGSTGRDGALLSVSSNLRKQGLNEAARVAEAETLDRAVDLARRFLSKGDARFLERVLLGEVPVRDHKMLSKKADFKMKYKARSGKIMDLLKKLQFTFTQNLRAASSKEKDAVSLHEKLMATKEEQLSKAEDAKAKMEVEGAARGLSKSEAQAEVDSLKTQISNDEGFITQTESDLKKKKEDWEVRKALRLAEIKAISEATLVLNNDDSRDLFHKSMSFVQLGSGAAGQRRGAVAALRSAFQAVSDRRLSALATRIAMGAGGNFDKVIETIDTMIATLNSEEEADLTTKESCEKDRAEDAREAAVIAREVDEHTDEITKLKEEIKEIEEEVETKQDEIKKMNEELKEATQNREKETAEWQVADAEDAEAITTVEAATQVLKKFYADNDLMLAQQAHKKEPTEGVVAGEAPPPPPTTWEAPYTGAQAESTGIISILEMVKEDMAKDKKAAKAEEDEAQAMYDQFKKDTEAQIVELNDAISALEKTKGEKETDVVDTETDKETKKGLLKAVMDKLKAAAPGCNYYLVNFKLRSSNRAIEIDGLNNAKAILQGAKFTKAEEEA